VRERLELDFDRLEFDFDRLELDFDRLELDLLDEDFRRPLLLPPLPPLELRDRDLVDFWVAMGPP
jgi:hypothetical protein